jgi:hypothetical protein
MEKSLTKNQLKNFIPLTHQTNIDIWVVHYIVQQSALNAMEKNQIQQLNHKIYLFKIVVFSKENHRTAEL